MTAVTVTAQHIAEGVREDCDRCPVALAILAAFPYLVYVRVGTARIRVRRDGARFLTSLATPPDAQNFIWDYDHLEDVEPFTFELDYPAAAS